MSKRPPARPAVPLTTGDVAHLLEPRLRMLRERLAKLKLDAILLTHAADIAYTTNFGGHDSVALITPTRVTIVTDGRYEEEVATHAPQATAIIRKKSLVEAVAQAIGKLRAGKVAFESNFVTFGFIEGIRGQLRAAKSAVKLAPVTDLMLTLRRVKDADEIERTRVAIRVAEESFTRVLPNVKPGQTESAVAGDLIRAMRSRGASDAAFEPIIAAGPHGSLPHYRPTMTAIENDSPLLVDWGATVNGYRSDLTRVVFFGRVDPRMEEIYKLVLDAQMSVIGKLRAGLNCKAADGIARKIITRGGYGNEFNHGLGHGLGRDIHEEPRLHYLRPNDVLEPGNVVTVEPGIYLPGVGGVRIEDDVLITENGCEVLTSLEKSFEWATNVTR